MDNSKIHLAFSALDQRIAENIPSKKEIKTNTYVTYGDKNNYPNFLYSTYSDCPSLQTIVNGLADYVVGDGVLCSVMAQPNPGETWDEFITHLAADYFLYGICYYQVVEAKNNTPKSLYWLDALYVRCDEDNETFYYNEDFGKSYVKTSNTISYPKYKAGFNQPTSVVCVKTPLGKGTYSQPIWGSALKSVLTEVAIDDFHLNEIDNNFSSTAIINFNNGVPSEEDMDEVEKKVGRKFTGHQNAGRFMLSFNNGVANRTTVERVNTDDFDKRYDALATKTQKQIFTAFGVSPVIFGVLRDTTGFSDQDFTYAFKLANKTRIQPVQKRFIDSIERVIGKNTLTIQPFTIDFGATTNNVQTVS